MAALSVQVDDALKLAAERASNSSHVLKDDVIQTIKDAQNGKDLYGPFRTGEEAVASMLED